MLDEVIRGALRRGGQRPAVRDRRAALTYAALLEASGDLAAHLPGDRAHVALYGANSVDYVVGYLALLRAGAVPFLVEPALTGPELAAVVDGCAIEAVLHDRPLPAPTGVGAGTSAAGLYLTRLERAARRDVLDGTEVCRFTSGSTGVPNCIEFSGDAVAAAARNWVAGTALTDRDRIVCFAGLTNGLAFNTSLLPAFLAGAELHLATGLPTASRVAALVRDTGATRLTGFPALYDSLSGWNGPAGTFAGLDLAVSSGARLDPHTARRLRERHGIEVRDYYGIAETGPVTFARTPGPGLGTALPGAEVRAGVPGAPAGIAVRTASMGSRYLNAPGVLEQRVDAEGFYRAGDVGYLDDGRLVLTGRTARYLNVAGRKVDPVEVRDVIRGVAGVRDALVLGIDTPTREVVAALVAASDGVREEDVREACRRALAAYKAPERIRIVPALPVTSIGKPRLDAARAYFDDRTTTSKGTS